MKKAFIFIAAIGLALSLSACSQAEIDIFEKEVLSSRESLATLSYLSGSLIDLDTTDPVLSNTLDYLSTSEETEVEGELDLVNEYMDRLKDLMDNGTESFGNAVESLSDNPLYALMISFTVNSEQYVIYYNIDPITFEISGILLIGDVEYVIEVSNTLMDNDDLEEDDDDDDMDNEEDEDDDNDDENEHGEDEQKMVLTAYNGENYVVVTYKVEEDDEEIETKFHLVSFIDGVEKEVYLKISIEDDEYKIKIEEEDNEFTFKREFEDGEIEYKLKYKVNGVEGEIKIIEKVNELGETVYEYHIEEGDHSSFVEKDEPDYKSDDDEDDDDEDDEDETDTV